MYTSFVKNIIVIFTIIGIFISPIQITFADTIVDLTDNSIDPNTGTNNSGQTPGGETVAKISEKYAGYDKLIGCKNVSSRLLGTRTLDALNRIVPSNKSKTNAKTSQEVTKTILNKNGEAIPVYNEELAKIAADQAATKALAEKEDAREECLNGLSYRIAKFSLGQITDKTVNYINTGFKGDSFILKDQNSYFSSLENNEADQILGIIGKFKNRKDYPYGREYARSFLNNRINTYDSRSRSSMTFFLPNGNTIQDYSNDFSKGGWNAWFGLTQNPQNNPLGFGLITSDEIAKRSAKATQEALNELNWGDGFLSQKKCVKPEDYTVRNKKKNPCVRWETVTPGTTITNQLNKVLGSPIDQLVMADEVNESLSQVFDALINQAMVFGVSKIKNKKKINISDTFGGPGENRVYDSFGNDITSTFTSSAKSGLFGVPVTGNWYDSNSTFDITKDLAKVIKDQTNYLEVLKESEKVLPEIAYSMRELDYCLPGPHPGWEASTYSKIQDYIDFLNDTSVDAEGNVIVPEGAYEPGWVTTTFGTLGSIGGMVGGPAGYALQGMTMIQGAISKNNQRKDSEMVDRIQRVADAEENLNEHLLRYSQIIKPELLERQFDEYRTEIYNRYGENLYEKNIPGALDMLAQLDGIDSLAETLDDSSSEYSDTINETTLNIAKLKSIQRQVAQIMSQKYVKDQRVICAAQGLPNNPGNSGLVSNSTTGTNSPNCSITKLTSKTPVTNFDSSTKKVSANTQVIVAWETDNCTNISIPGVGYGLPSSGSKNVYPNVTNTYKLIAKNSVSSDNKSITVEVTP